MQRKRILHNKKEKERKIQMNLIKLFLISEVLSDDDPILIERERKRERKNSLKNRWKKALTDPVWWCCIIVLGLIIALI
jgi:hypothetical protein